MDENLKKITLFLEKHHVMSLATCHEDVISNCSLFYAYKPEQKCFIVASSEATTHIQHTLQNPHVAGNILLETKIVGKIQGVQFRGVFSLVEDEKLRTYYFKKFPHAMIMRPKLWKIEVDFFKMTDNTLGFGKKILWEKSTAL